MVVEIVAQDGGDAHGQQWEHGEDGLSRLAHVAHVAEGDEGYDRDAEHGVLQRLVLQEVEGEGGGCHDEHDEILHDGHRGACPEGIGVNLGEGEVALEHVDGILLEGEDGRIIEHAEQGYNPEAAVG